jgi:hypothetical protein
VGVAAILATKFRAAYAKSHSKLAALREVIQQLQDGNLLAPEPQPEQPQEEEQEQQGQDQDEAGQGGGGDHYGEVVLELKDIQQHQQQQQSEQQQQKDFLLDFE